MKKPLDKVLSFYKSLYKDLHQDTINSPYFLSMLEFDILLRFNMKLNKKTLDYLIKNLGGQNKWIYVKTVIIVHH